MTGRTPMRAAAARRSRRRATPWPDLGANRRRVTFYAATWFFSFYGRTLEERAERESYIPTFGEHVRDLRHYQWCATRFQLQHHDLAVMWGATSYQPCLELERWFEARGGQVSLFLLQCRRVTNRRVLNYRLLRAVRWGDAGYVHRWLAFSLPRYCAMRARRGLNLVGWETLR